MKNCLTNQPQKAVHTCPKFADFYQSFCAVFKKIQRINTISETENKSARDNRRNEGSKNFSRHCRRALQNILICARRRFYRVFRYAFNACKRCKILVKFANRVTDDNLKLPCLA